MPVRCNGRKKIYVTKMYKINFYWFYNYISTHIMKIFFNNNFKKHYCMLNVDCGTQGPNVSCEVF
jgi:hypothetical protein